MDRKRIVSFLKNLVGIDSSSNSLEISDYVSGVLEEYGYDAQVDSQGNIVSSIGRGEGFLLNSHLDTVPAVGWRTDPFKPVVRHGRLYGRGSTDCKSGVACMMEMAANAAEMDLEKRVYFTFSAKEEAGNLDNNGSYKILKKIKAKRGLVLEPSVKGKSISIVFGCKGIYRCEIDILGKAAHSGSPWRGVNPIYLLPNFLCDIQSLRKKSTVLQAYGQEFKIGSVCSITQVNAMEGSNVIPGKCTLTLDYRTVPGETKQSIKDGIRGICEKNLCKFAIHESSFYSSEYCLDDAFYDYCAKVASKHGFSPRPKFTNGRNDVTVFKKYGKINCFSIGPGTLGQLHRNPEYVDLKGFLKASRMIEDMVLEY